MAVLAVGALAPPAVDQAAAYRAYRRFRDADWRKTATREQTRATAEHALEWRFGRPHDEFLVLMAIGDRSSAPYIRAALRRRPPGSGDCGWEHAEEALEQLCRDECGDPDAR